MRHEGPPTLRGGWVGGSAWVGGWVGYLVLRQPQNDPPPPVGKQRSGGGVIYCPHRSPLSSCALWSLGGPPPPSRARLLVLCTACVGYVTPRIFRKVLQRCGFEESEIDLMVTTMCDGPSEARISYRSLFEKGMSGGGRRGRGDGSRAPPAPMPPVACTSSAHATRGLAGRRHFAWRHNRPPQTSHRLYGRPTGAHRAMVVVPLTRFVHPHATQRDTAGGTAFVGWCPSCHPPPEAWP